MENKTNKINELLKLIIVPMMALMTGIASQDQFIEWLSSIVGIVTAVPIIVEWMKVTWNFSDKKFWRFYIAQWATFGVSIAMVYLSWLLRYGFTDLTLSFLTLLKLLIAGLLIGFAASNSWFKIEWVQLALARLFDRLDKVKKLEEARALRKEADKLVK